MITIKMGGAIASAAAMLALGGYAQAQTATQERPAGSRGAVVSANQTVHCYGVNTCAGTADCATTDHQCKGQNQCRGQGFKAMTAKACLDAGGSIADLGPLG
ncbi:hypothetical protein GVN24_25150 [Rhizobium sp. CRIBSB]|nr:hypothetical protein [Rhizobium sp. CRIBSB]